MQPVRGGRHPGRGEVRAHASDSAPSFVSGVTLSAIAIPFQYWATLVLVVTIHLSTEGNEGNKALQGTSDHRDPAGSAVDPELVAALAGSEILEPSSRHE